MPLLLVYIYDIMPRVYAYVISVMWVVFITYFGCMICYTRVTYVTPPPPSEPVPPKLYGQSPSFVYIVGESKELPKVEFYHNGKMYKCHEGVKPSKTDFTMDDRITPPLIKLVGFHKIIPNGECTTQETPVTEIVVIDKPTFRIVYTNGIVGVCIGFRYWGLTALLFDVWMFDINCLGGARHDLGRGDCITRPKYDVKDFSYDENRIMCVLFKHEKNTYIETNMYFDERPNIFLPWETQFNLTWKSEDLSHFGEKNHTMQFSHLAM